MCSCILTVNFVTNDTCIAVRTHITCYAISINTTKRSRDEAINWPHGRPSVAHPAPFRDKLNEYERRNNSKKKSEYWLNLPGQPIASCGNFRVRIKSSTFGRYSTEYAVPVSDRQTENSGAVMA